MVDYLISDDPELFLRNNIFGCVEIIKAHSLVIYTTFSFIILIITDEFIETEDLYTYICKMNILLEQIYLVIIIIYKYILN